MFYTIYVGERSNSLNVCVQVCVQIFLGMYKAVAKEGKVEGIE